MFRLILIHGQIGDSISNLPIGGYSIDVYDATGCVFHTATMLNYDPADSCFSRIEGTVFYDFNANCVQDPLEVGLANIYIDIAPGGAAFTDANGHYSFIVNDTGYYQLQFIPINNALIINNCLPPNLSFSSYIASLGTDSLANDFPIDFLADMKVTLVENNYTPGMPHFGYIQCYNISYYLSNATLTYEHDAMITSPTFLPTPDNYNPATHTATWNFLYFTPGSIRNIQI